VKRLTLAIFFNGAVLTNPEYSAAPRILLDVIDSDAPTRQTRGGRDAGARVPPVDYRDERRRCSHEPLPQQTHSLPQPSIVAPFSRD